MPTDVAPGVKFWTREELGLPAADLTYGAGQKILRVHYTTGQELGRSDFAAWWRGIDAYHRSKGWSGVGYSFGVARDPQDPDVGHVLEGRGWNVVGAHTFGHNGDLGVAFLGNDDPGVDDVTPGARRAYVWLREEGSDRAGLSGLMPAFPHSVTSSTSCPGDELRAWVAAGMPAPGAPAPVPAPAPSAVVDLAAVQTAARKDPARAQGGTTAGAADDVRVVERALVAERLLDSRWVDGSFGGKTVEAYAGWQRRLGYHGGDADGIPGKSSLTALGRRHGFTVAATSGGSVTRPKVDVSMVQAAARLDPGRAQGGTTRGAADDVKVVERALVAERLLEARWVDGSFGSKTAAAYAAWQRKLGYAGDDADGIPGSASLRELGRRHGFDVVA